MEKIILNITGANNLNPHNEIKRAIIFTNTKKSRKVERKRLGFRNVNYFTIHNVLFIVYSCIRLN